MIDDQHDQQDKDTSNPIDDAKRRIEEDNAQRMKICGEAVQAVLQKHKCNLIAQPFVDREGRISASVSLAVTE